MSAVINSRPEVRCHHDMLPGMCSWCLGITEQHLSHTATTYSRCVTCGEMIAPGDTYVNAGRGRKRGECCL